MQRWWEKWRLRRQALVDRSQVENDLEDELRDYVEREVEREVAAGATPGEARRRALASFHGAERVKEECRDARRVRWLEEALSDVRFAIRTLRKAPVFTVTVVAALAFCIGVNTAIFSVVDTVLFRPLPFPEQERLVTVTEGIPGLGFPVIPFSPPDYLFVAAHSRSFAGTGTYRTQAYEMSGAGRPRRVSGARVTASLFRVLGVLPAWGRSFTREEDERSKRLAVLSYGFAQSAFGGPERALGRTVLLDRTPYTVTGVMPRSFSFPIRGSRFNSDPAEVFVPVSWSSDERQQTVSNFDYSMVARLQANVTIGQASAELHELLQRVVEGYPAGLKAALTEMPNFSLESRIAPFREEFTGSVERPLLLLLAAVGVVLLIGCADVANLMFSRLVGRQRELALRSALGAGRWRLVRQTMTEGLVLAVSGGAIGFGLAFWMLPVLIRWAPENLPRSGEIGLNGRMLAFAMLVTLGTPLVFCLGPLVNSFGVNVVNQLRGEGRSTTQGKRQRRMMASAVVIQFSLAFVLLTTAGLLTRSLSRAMEANPGFRAEHLLIVPIALPTAAYKTPAQFATFFDRLLARVSTLPGVRQAGALSDLPMGSTDNVIISIEGRGKYTERVDTVFCRGNALESIGVSLLRGRLLRPEDQISKPNRVVISDAMVKRIWPHSDPIGKRFRFGVAVPNNDAQWLTVVGVVGDVKARLNSDSPRLLVFMPPQDWVNHMSVVVQTAGDPLVLASAIRMEVKRLDPSLAVGKVETVDRVLADSLSAERFRTWLLVSFATAALLLAMLGIAGLLAYDTAQRRQEFGVRIALGARRRALLLLVLGHCSRLCGTGIAFGLAASIFATRALGSLLYRTSPLDLMTLVAVPVILVLVATGASLVPAWRAMRTDPMVALRAE